MGQAAEILMLCFHCGRIAIEDDSEYVRGVLVHNGSCRLILEEQMSKDEDDDDDDFDHQCPECGHKFMSYDDWTF